MHRSHFLVRITTEYIEVQLKTLYVKWHLNCLYEHCLFLTDNQSERAISYSTYYSVAVATCTYQNEAICSVLDQQYFMDG